MTKVQQSTLASWASWKFDPKTDTLTAYKERAMLYLDANNIPRERWAAIFLGALGKSTFQVLSPGRLC